MKFLSTILIAVLLAHGTIARPEPFFGEIAKGIADSIAGAANAAGNIVAGVAKGWGKLASGTVNAAKNIAEAAINGGVNIVTGIANKWASMTGNVAERFANMTISAEDAFKNVLNIGDNTFKKIGAEIRNRINEINEQVTDMMSEAQNKFKEGLGKVNDALQENKAKIEDWIEEIKSKHNYASASEEDMNRVDQLVQDFVRKSSEDLSKCAEEMSAPLKEMYKKAEDSVNIVLPATEKVIKDLGDCFKANLFNPIKLTQCAWEAKKQLPGVADIADMVKKLQKDMENIDLNKILDMSCMKDSLDKIKERSKELDRKIGEIVDGKTGEEKDSGKDSKEKDGDDKKEVDDKEGKEKGEPEQQ